MNRKYYLVIAGIALILTLLLVYYDLSSSKKVAKTTTSPTPDELTTPPSSAKVSSDGLTCEAIVPANDFDGVPCVDSTNGQKLELDTKDTYGVEVTGLVDIGRGVVTAEGHKGYYDKSVDSPFENKVGGLEMFPDGKGYNFNTHQFIGSSYSGNTFKGVPVFRVIESLIGYKDKNRGYFKVVITKQTGMADDTIPPPKTTP